MILQLLNFRILKGLLSLSKKGYFVDTGWLISYAQKKALNQANQPIPWLTYSFLDFIDDKKYLSADIFEYGAGNSTLYFSKKAKSITSVEHNKEWYQYISQSIPDNVDISLIGLDDDKYENAILKHDKQFDIILIDGRKRVKCIKNAIQKCSERCVIILDDAEREEYAEAFIIMKEQGFKHLPFSGIAIGAIHRKITSLFYKTNNIFEI